MRHLLLTFTLAVYLVSCTSKQGSDIKVFKNKSNYTLDKAKISNLFIDYIETFRSDSTKVETVNFFQPYSVRYNKIEGSYVTSPLPTYKQLKVIVDTIVYNNDSSLFFAICVLKLAYDEFSFLETERDEGRNYDAKAIIGYRANQNDSIWIYPVKEFSVIGFPNYNSAVTEMKEYFFNNLKGIGRTGSVYEKLKFKSNLGDKSFFLENPYFQKHKSGIYNFQMFRHLGVDKPYNYQPHLGVEYIDELG